jgi:fructose-1-phosphate kinase PfkB-like protein
VSKKLQQLLVFHAGGLASATVVPTSAHNTVGLHDAVVDGVVGEGGIGEAPVAFPG